MFSIEILILCGALDVSMIEGNKALNKVSNQAQFLSTGAFYCNSE